MISKTNHCNVRFSKEVMFQEVSFLILLSLLSLGSCNFNFTQNPAPDLHRCGVCPTYFQKICAFNYRTNETYIFDNHCIMDVYNCIHGSEFQPLNYENCLYFGNFAYVHGYKYEDEDYGEDNIVVKDVFKNPIYRRNYESE